MPEITSRSLSPRADVLASTSEMLSEVVRSLTSRPDCVTAKILDEGGTSVIVIMVAAADLQGVLGREGRTARSLRAITRAIGRRTGQRLEVDVQVDDQGCL